VNDVSFSIRKGDLFTFVGPSGCGKSTTLRCIAGLERPDEGRIVVAGRTVFDSDAGVFVPPHERDIGMVFQTYAIWPHMSAFENVAFPLRESRRRDRRSRQEIDAAVREAFELIRMTHLMKRRATQLSGGEQQRLAFARAIVGRPNLLLLDEPLSNLDARLRDRMKFEVKRLQHQLQITTLFVTHDQSEALALSDELAVFDHGRIVQRGTPRQVYSAPETAFVASFLGAANVLVGILLTERDAAGLATVRLDAEGGNRSLCGRLVVDVPVGSEIAACIRAEDCTIEPDDDKPAGPDPAVNVISGRLLSSAYQGTAVDHIVEALGGEIRVRSTIAVAAALNPGDPVRVSAPAGNCRLVAADVPAETAAAMAGLA
jgi:iron(III) transport system ATP-binding protein